MRYGPNQAPRATIRVEYDTKSGERASKTFTSQLGGTRGYRQAKSFYVRMHNEGKNPSLTATKE